MTSRSAFFQARADELLHRRRGAEHRLRGADGVVRLALLEAQRHERQRGVVGFLVNSLKRMFGAGGFQGARCADFVAQFHDDALGGLFADAGNL